MSWRLTLPFPKPPLSLNDRLHWAVQRQRKQEIKEAVIVLSRHSKLPPLERVAVELHYEPRDRRRRDEDNMAATLKPCLDGLVAAGIIRDDTPLFVQSAVCKLDPPNGRRGVLYLLVEDANVSGSDSL